MEASFQTKVATRSKKWTFVPQETLDHPFDVTLVVRGGKEFKAHRRVLSEASPFFQKLFNSDMKESNEGVVCMEILTELIMGDILEFIYSGCVQITAKDYAKEMIAMADYLILPSLKAVAENVLTKKLNMSSALSTYYFLDRYQCKEFISETKKFILANFTGISGTKDF